MAICKTHQRVSATFTCGACLQPMCDDCAVYGADGVIVCRECQSRTAGQIDAGYDLAPAPQPTIIVPPRPQTAAPRCLQHPENPSVAWCANCGNPVCATCDFAFPGNIHLCPPCATNPKQKLSPVRRAKALWSIGMGASSAAVTFGSLLLVVLLRSNMDNEGLGAIFCFILIFGVAALIGFVLGITCFKRNSYNPGFLWIGPVLNGVVISLWILLIVGIVLKM